jgi:hypothetical protein
MTDYQIENQWAHIYHDSIKGKKWLDELGLNIGRWAGSYAFFYILNRILSDYNPKNILELGLGESSKFISSFLTHELLESTHHIIEQDAVWKDVFESKNLLSERSSIEIIPIEQIKFKNKTSIRYEDLSSKKELNYDLYLIDGPYGSRYYSRYDIVDLLSSKTKEDDFIIIMDDCERFGEYQTFKNLLKLLQTKGVEHDYRIYRGLKDIGVIGTNKYKFVTTL